MDAADKVLLRATFKAMEDLMKALKTLKRFVGCLIPLLVVAAERSVHVIWGP